MSAIEPAELSALLDGELSAERARAVEAALASDAALRAEFEALARADAAWRAHARTAAFVPAIAETPAARTAIGWPAAATLIAALAAFKLLTKLGDGLSWPFLLHGAAFAALLFALPWLIRKTAGAAAREA
jgi:anti-sigma factor RsiW